MARELSYNKVDEFFRNLADKHTDIKDYCGTSVDELADRIASVSGLQSPYLNFFMYHGRLTGNEQRTFNIRTLKFAIIFTGIQKEDYQEQRNKITQAEEIGLEVLSRIYIQSKMPNIGWLYNNFDKNSVMMEEVISEGSDNFYGMEFEFNLKVSEPLVVDGTKWADGDIFCTS